MKIVKLFTGKDNKSHFEVLETGVETKQSLGSYSKEYRVEGMFFRNFDKGAFFDWHNAPRRQFVVYLEGEVEVQASGGETQVFRPGDILLASDLDGEGHITRTLTSGHSIVVTLDATKSVEEQDFDIVPMSKL